MSPQNRLRGTSWWLRFPVSATFRLSSGWSSGQSSSFRTTWCELSASSILFSLSYEATWVLPPPHSGRRAAGERRGVGGRATDDQGAICHPLVADGERASTEHSHRGGANPRWLSLDWHATRFGA